MLVSFVRAVVIVVSLDVPLDVRNVVKIALVADIVVYIVNNTLSAGCLSPTCITLVLKSC